MKRSTQITIAAVVLFLYSVVGLISEVPNLARGSATGPNEAPFALTLFSFVLALSGVFASYGLWMNTKWGKVLAIVVPALSILYSLVPLLVAPPPLKLMAGVGIAISILIIVLVLRRTPKPVSI